MDRSSAVPSWPDDVGVDPPVGHEELAADGAASAAVFISPPPVAVG